MIANAEPDLGGLLGGIEPIGAARIHEYRAEGYDDDLETETATVLILITEEWGFKTAADSQVLGDLVWSTLADYGVHADVIVRTEAEHEAARVDDGSWRPVDKVGDEPVVWPPPLMRKKAVNNG